MPTAKKSIAGRRSLARFIRALGACVVPANIIRRKPEAAWEAASTDQQQWIRNKVFRLRGRKHATNIEACWCSGISLTPAHKRSIFAAFLKFQRTGKLPSKA